jgi:hypothetical protein
LPVLALLLLLLLVEEAGLTLAVVPGVVCVPWLEGRRRWGGVRVGREATWSKFKY